MNEENWGNNGKGRPGVALVGVTYFCHKHDFVTNLMWAFHWKIFIILL